MGQYNNLYHADYYAERAMGGRVMSTKGVGRTEPDPSEEIKLADGVRVPVGKGVQSLDPNPGKSLLYNEYIVYNVDQIRMRFLIQCKFKYR